MLNAQTGEFTDDSSEYEVDATTSVTAPKKNEIQKFEFNIYHPISLSEDPASQQSFASIVLFLFLPSGIQPS